MPFSNLSRADLNFLIEAEIAAAKKGNDKETGDGEMEKKKATGKRIEESLLRSLTQRGSVQFSERLF